MIHAPLPDSGRSPRVFPKAAAHGAAPDQPEGSESEGSEGYRGRGSESGAQENQPPAEGRGAEGVWEGSPNSRRGSPSRRLGGSAASPDWGPACMSSALQELEQVGWGFFKYKFCSRLVPSNLKLAVQGSLVLGVVVIEPLVHTSILERKGQKVLGL